MTDHDVNEIATEILNHVVTAKMGFAADTLANQCQYTTTALLAMAQFQADNGDVDGAKLILAFAHQFAQHEAATI